MKYNEDFKVSPELRKLVDENLPKLKKALFQNDLSFFFIPSPTLKELVAKNENPIVKKLPQAMRELILDGKPFAIQKRMVYELLTGELDQDNTFILSRGDIRALGVNETVLNVEGTRNDN